MTMPPADGSKLLAEFVGALTFARECALFPGEADFNNVATTNLRNGTTILLRELTGQEPTPEDVERLLHAFLFGPKAGS